MNIVLVGGAERSLSHLRRAASACGHHLEHHDGACTPRGERALSGAIGRADLVVIVTGINSHRAVLLARELVERKHVPSLICRRFGVTQLWRLLDALALRRDREARRALEGAGAALAASSAGTFLTNHESE